MAFSGCRIEVKRELSRAPAQRPIHSNSFEHARMKFYFFSEFGGGICGEAVAEV